MMSRFYYLGCLCSLFLLALSAEIATTTTQTPTSTAPGDIVCSQYPVKYYPTRTTCTPVPGLDDDAVTIQAAIEKAGNYYGFVLLPQGQTFTIRSPIEIANCTFCGISVEGALKVGGTESDWGTAESFIEVRDAVEVFISGVSGEDSSNGIIDASDVKFSPETTHVPSLFHFIRSGPIFPTNIKLKNAPGTYFDVEDLEKIDAKEVTILTEAEYTRPDSYGIRLGNVRYIFFDGVKINFEGEKHIGGCIAVDGVPSGGVTLRNIVCTNTQTGVTVTLGSSSSAYQANDAISANQIRVTNLTVDADIATGILNPGFPRVNVFDVIFDNVTVLGGEAFAISNEWILPGQDTPANGSVSRNYTDIWLKNFHGKLSSPPQNQTGETTVDVHIQNWGS